MSDEILRAAQLNLLQPTGSISPRGARGLAMLTRGVELADEVGSHEGDESSVSGSLISYELVCAGNLGTDRAMAQYDMEAVNTWSQSEGQQLATEFRLRVQRSLFEVGFVEVIPG